MADNTVSNVDGSVQEYWQTRWMALPQREFDTPLANSALGMTATLPKHVGPIAEFRKFDNFDPETESGNDSPKMHSETSEPSAGKKHTASRIRVPLAHFRDYVSLGPLVQDVDPVDLVKRSFDEFRTMIRRQVHRKVNDVFVRGTIDTNSFVADTTKIPGAFRSTFAGGAQSYGELTDTHFHDMETWKLTRSRMEADGVPKPFPDLYAAIISDSIKNQLMDDDKDFRDIIKRMTNDSNKKVFVNATMIDYNGFRWIIQDDEYRCNLPNVTGAALTTRVNAGRVHVGHALGRMAFGYVDLAGKKRLNPNFKVQDISKTGVETTIGYSIPFQCANIDRDYALNVVGTTKYFKGVSD